ncbi:MAG TPA: bifunctional oligoribonuclease/PAP phosphatase NrnA [Bacilli bacterium]|nr:bifunctional oligoribonuclease/PAP phosphatase NrnA [Bacilli bacterium]
MNLRSEYHKIYRQIKKFDTIVIARHVGPDPDALSSQIGLKEAILNKFPNKKVYAVGATAQTFKYLGNLDKFNDEMYNNSMLIVLDTPDSRRVDGVTPKRFKYLIKIDHHPFIEKFCDIEKIDDTSSSCAQLIIELINNTPLKMTKSIAEKLFIGIIADTNRFLFKYTTPKTFKLVSNLIRDTKIEFTDLYEKLYLRPVKEVRFQGYISDNMIITENGFAYIKLTNEDIKKYNVDAATAGNMVGNFNYIMDVYAWAVFTEDLGLDQIRGSIRSRGPIINEIASHFGGGGHIFASGVRLKDFNEVDALVKELDEACKVYKEDK